MHRELFQASRVSYRTKTIGGNDRHDGENHGRSPLCAFDCDSGDQTEATESVHHQRFLGLDSRFFLEKFLKKLLGRNDVEDALKRLDKLTQEEAKMATAEVLKFTRGMDSNIKVLIDGAQTRLSSNTGPDGLCRQMAKRRNVCHFLTLPLFCLRLSHGHRKANATGPPQVVISAGFFNKSQHRAQSSLQGNCYLVFPRWYLQEVEVESFALVDTWQTYVYALPCCHPIHLKYVPLQRALARVYFG